MAIAFLSFLELAIRRPSNLVDMRLHSTPFGGLVRWLSRKLGSMMGLSSEPKVVVVFKGIKSQHSTSIEVYNKDSERRIEVVIVSA